MRFLINGTMVLAGLFVILGIINLWRVDIHPGTSWVMRVNPKVYLAIAAILFIAASLLLRWTLAP